MVGDELGEFWKLLPEDLALVAALPDAGKLGLAAQLAFWRQNGRFPEEEADLVPAVVGHLANQVGVRPNFTAFSMQAIDTTVNPNRALSTLLSI